MFDPVFTFGALLHALLLIGVIVYFCRRLSLPWRDGPFVVAILLWADLVLAGHMASLAQSLGNLAVYIPATFAALAALLTVLAALHRLPDTPLSKPPQLAFAPIEHLKVRRLLFWFFGLTLAFAALASIVLGLSVYPDNADSMIYRLPRAFWYVSHGSFMHPFASLDRRLVFYPLNGVALYVPMVLYNLPGTAFSLPSLASWFLVVYAVYRFARELGAERLIALWASWLIGLTPSILAQATSTNDEILTGAAFLAGLFLGWRWLVTGRRSYFMLACLAVGLSIGTKLHIVFLMPIVLAALGIAVWHVLKKRALLPRWLNAIGWRAGLLGLFGAALMIAPFLLYNYASTGRLYFFDDFARQVFNVKGSLQGAFQNLLIYTSQMVLSPIGDLNIWPDALVRQEFNRALNAFFNPFIKPFIDEDTSFYHFNYRFAGVTLPVSVRFVEFSLWSGFVWLMWPWQAWLALRQRFPLRVLFFLFAVTPPLWLLLWSASTLYMEGTATYFAYYLIVAAPACVFAFAPMDKTWRNDLRWVTIVVVTLTNMIICGNLLMYSGFRALPDLVYARAWPYDWDLTEPGIIAELRRADKIRIAMTHEKMPYFAYMHWNPRARYYSPYPMATLPEVDKVLQILPVTSFYEYGFMPLKIPGKKTYGMTYLGTIRGIGREVVFAVGNGVHTRWPAQSDYIVVHVIVKTDGNGATIEMEKQVSGLYDEDGLAFRYELKQGNKTLFSRDWDKDPTFSAHVPVHPAKTPTMLTLIVRDEASRKELTRATYQVDGPGAWLPDGAEY